jgi:hypothetical protein
LLTPPPLLKAQKKHWITVALVVFERHLDWGLPGSLIGVTG